MPRFANEWSVQPVEAAVSRARDAFGATVVDTVRIHAADADDRCADATIACGMRLTDAKTSHRVDTSANTFLPS